MRIEPAESCNVTNVASLWRNEPHWHTVWPEGPTWCYPTAEEAAGRAVEVTEIRALAGLNRRGERSTVCEHCDREYRTVVEAKACALRAQNRGELPPLDGLLNPVGHDGPCGARL